jgi:hypothetical protein
MAADDSQPRLEERLAAIEAQAAKDREELARLRSQVAANRDSPVVAPPPARRATPSQAPKSSSTLRSIAWVLGFAAGATVTYATVVYELHWHWAFGILLAPIGGVVVILLGESGATV